MTVEDYEAMHRAATAVGQQMARFNQESRVVAKQIADAMGVPRWILGLAPPPRYVCVWCRRRFKGGWQLRKHRRTAHGLSSY